MTARGYSNKYLIADAIGKHDGIAPVQSLDLLIEAAENWVDRRTSRSWLNVTITGEPHQLYGDRPLLWLRRSPVLALTAVTARTMWANSTIQTLPTTAYELIDAARGKVLVSTSYYNSLLLFSYTTDIPVPADIKLATTLLVASWVTPMIQGDVSIQGGIKSYSIGQDLSVTFQDADKTMALSAPVEVLRLLEPYRTLAFA